MRFIDEYPCDEEHDAGDAKRRSYGHERFTDSPECKVESKKYRHEQYILSGSAHEY